MLFSALFEEVGGGRWGPQKEPKMFWNKWKSIFLFFLVMIDIIHNLFLPTKNGKKMRNILERIFEFMRCFFVRFLVFELWSILYFISIVHSELRRNKIFFMLNWIRNGTYAYVCMYWIYLVYGELFFSYLLWNMFAYSCRKNCLVY